MVIEMSQTLKIEMDNEVLLGMDKTPEEMANEMRLAAAVKWYELGILSQGKAACVNFMIDRSQRRTKM
ncbi:MAG: hypothetical protein C4527_00505 [Candidatus Omnitrophota bacterium]|jgi:hypothetical protein|nr:MAG: hypothetical protein C4527_00505 [Candidatus Omnitrophota bacterium]